MRRNFTIIPRYLDILDWRRRGETFQQIGDRLGVSRQRAWEIHQRALKRISRVMGKDNPQYMQKRAA